MDNSELIENFFTGGLNHEQVRAFETRISSDAAFAEEVAFYLSAHTVSREMSQSERKQQFRELYQKSQPAKAITPAVIRKITPLKSRPAIVRKLIYSVAAAAVVVGITFGIYTDMQPGSPQQLAAKYELEHFKTLSVTMGNDTSSLQEANNLYNAGKADQALAIYETICQNDSTNSKARENAGLAALHVKDYDKALIYFRQLAAYTNLFSNPGLFNEALTLMTRNQPGDTDSAKLLLQQVVAKDLDGKETAQEWLKEWKK